MRRFPSVIDIGPYITFRIRSSEPGVHVRYRPCCAIHFLRFMQCSTFFDQCERPIQLCANVLFIDSLEQCHAAGDSSRQAAPRRQEKMRQGETDDHRPWFVSTMSTSITSRISSASQQLRATGKILQDMAFDAKCVWTDETRHVGWLKSSFQYPGCHLPQD